MIGDNYLIKLGRSSQNEITLALYSRFDSLFKKDESEEYAGKIAAAVAMTIVGEPAPAPEHQQFRENNKKRIGEAIDTLVEDFRVREILSGAAYNIAYGRYVENGGGRLFNTFLAFIRIDDHHPKSLGDRELLSNYKAKLTNRSETILRPIEALKKLYLWQRRGQNPNEAEYYKAVHKFAAEHGVSFK